MRLGAPTLVLVGVAFASSARGQSPSSPDMARAEGLFQSGRQLMREGRFHEACPKLEESQRLDPAPGTRLNLADCWEHEGRTASAHREFLGVAQIAEKNGEKERAAIAKNRARLLEGKLTRLVLSVPPGARVRGLQLFRNSALVPEAEWDVAQAVDPGAFVIEARAPGRHVFRSAFKLQNDAATHHLTIPALVADRASTPPDGAGTTRGEWLQRGGVGLVGLGALGIALGTVFGVRAVRLYHQSQDEGCDQRNACPAPALVTRDSAVHSGNISTASFVVGGVLLAGGAGIYVWGTRQRSSEQAGLSMHIVPLSSGGFLGVDSIF
jgi:hypothetical protein